MQISKKSWMYEVAYGLSGKKPEVTNLCNFFWRTVFMLFIGWPVMTALCVVIGGCMYVFGLFIDGSYPDCPEDPKKEMNWVPYKHWLIIGGSRLSPLGLLMAFFGGFWGWNLKDMLWLFLKAISPLLVIFGIVIALLSLVIIVGFFVHLVDVVLPKKIHELSQTSEFYKLIKEYILAKKQKICPIINFTE